MDNKNADPQIISNGKEVTLSYMIRSASGEILEYNDMPVTYQHGGNSDLFPEIELALEGKREGDEVTVEIPWAQAFGPHDPGLTFTDELENSPPEMRYIGAEMAAENASGEVLEFRVTQISDDKITIDANHPLAGKDLVFVVTVKAVS